MVALPGMRGQHARWLFKWWPRHVWLICSLVRMRMRMRMVVVVGVRQDMPCDSLPGSLDCGEGVLVGSRMRAVVSPQPPTATSPWGVGSQLPIILGCAQRPPRSLAPRTCMHKCWHPNTVSPPPLPLLCAANGNLQAGTELIFRAGTMVAPNLQRMVTQTQELGQKGGQEEALAELESACQRLAVCLGESNYYGAIFTIKKMLEEGKDEMVVTGWGNLNQGIIHGFTNLVLALPPTTHSIKNALREHSRLVEALSSRPLLAERAQQQDAQLQDLVAKAGELRQEQ